MSSKHKKAVPDKRFQLDEPSSEEAEMEEESLGVDEQENSREHQDAEGLEPDNQSEDSGAMLEEPENGEALTKEEQIARAKEYQEKMERRGMLSPVLTVRRSLHRPHSSWNDHRQN